MTGSEKALTVSSPVPVVPPETLYKTEFWAMGSFLELSDGRLFYCIGQGVDKCYASEDGGKSWKDQWDICLVDGGELKGLHAANLVRLPCGDIGLVCTMEQPDADSSRLVFSRSGDDGQTWSVPTQISEPHLTPLSLEHDAAIVTSSGRIVIPVYRRIGRRDFVPDKKTFFAVALLGDEWSLAGSHGFEPHPLLSWVYYSDDDGQTWHRNANGEMMVTLDYEAGGNFSAEEPVVVEYTPGHLLMLYRTPLGRLFQSWSSDLK